MIHMPISEVIDKIKAETGLSETEIKSQINAKVKSLEGLVSEEGAAYIIASDHGIKLFPDTNAEVLKLKDVLVGMKSVDTVGKVTRVFEPRTFQKGGQTNQVGNFVISDETGAARVVLWDKRVDLLKEGKIFEGQVVKIKNGYVKESQFSGKEIHIGTRGQLLLNFDAEVEVNEESAEEQTQRVARQAKVGEVADGQAVKLIGTIVKVFNPNFYDVCPSCNRKAVNIEGKFSCNEHGEVNPEVGTVANIILDDGTGSIRVVAFQKVAEKLMDGPGKEIKRVLEENGELEFQAQLNERLLGLDIEVEGTVRDNREFDRMELIASRINLNLNPIAVAKILMEAK